MKSGFVAIIAEPNAGKSTLVNFMVGHKISIVTHKVQTTRRRILGICLKNKTQIIFMDTPGVFQTNIIDNSFTSVSWNASKVADINIVLLDVTRKNFEFSRNIIVNLINRNASHIILCFNKVDKSDKNKLLYLINHFSRYKPIKKMFIISSLTGSGVDDLLLYLEKILPQRSWLYPKGQITNISKFSMAEEIVREKILINIHKEVPYTIVVKCDKWENKFNTSLLYLTLYVERISHKHILLGKNGTRMKHIIFDSCRDLESIFLHTVKLYIFIKMCR